MLAPGSSFAGRYRIVRRIAAGGMGAVFEAVHVETERACALKLMLPQLVAQRDMYERFKQEARAAAQVDNEHVVQVFDAGMDEETDTPFLVMELLRGEDLSHRVARTGPLSKAETAALLLQAARGIDALHRANIVHRDLKPSNIFLAERDAGPPRVKILDLGIAKQQSAPATTQSEALGTPLYMASEQLHGNKISSATDIHALGMIAFTLLVGKEYWAEEQSAKPSSLAFMMAILDGPREPASARAARYGASLPAAFDAWFARATADDPESRFPTATKAIEALIVALGENPDEMHLAGGNPRSHGPLSFAPTQKASGKASETTQQALDAPNLERTATAPPAASKVEQEKPKRSPRAWLFGSLSILLAALGSLVVWREWKAAPVPPPSPAKAAVISSLACAPATLSGHAPTPALAAALGLGACARLGVELGVPWLAEKDGAPLDVAVDLRADGSARAKLSALGRSAEATEKSPLLATNAAVAALAKELAAPALTPAEIAAWGASDEASARRIARIFRRHAFSFHDGDAEFEALLRSDPDSPFPHFMLALGRPSQSEESIRGRSDALSRLGRLPAGRGHLLEGVLLTFRRLPDDPPGRGVVLIRQAYGELADDPDFGAILTTHGCIMIDEGWAMFDRIAERFPSARAPLARCALGITDDRERRSRTLDGVRAVLPEAAIRTAILLDLGRIDEARAAIDLAARLGAPRFPRTSLEHDRAQVAFAALEPEKALAAADVLFGDPDFKTSTMGGNLRIHGLALGGRCIEAENATNAEYVRQMGANAVEEALELFQFELQSRRLVGHPLSKTDKRLAEVERLLSEGRRSPLGLEIELLLMRPGQTQKTLDAALAKMEAERSEFKTHQNEWALSQSLTLLRRARGDDAAIAAWLVFRDRDARRRAGFEAGLALEAKGRGVEAERAYRVAMEKPEWAPLDAVAARLRLARLVRARGAEAEARSLEAEVERAWSGADPGLRDLVLQMR